LQIIDDNVADFKYNRRLVAFMTETCYMATMAKPKKTSKKGVGAPRTSSGAPDDTVRFPVELPRSLRDAALERARELDLSLGQVVRMMLRDFTSGRINVSIHEDF
jgi:hypothetical protein